MDTLAIPVVDHPLDATVTIPGSKSITNRALLAAALAEGSSVLEEALFSEDTLIFANCLQRLGVAVEPDEAARRFTVQGCGGQFGASQADLFVGNAGTAARFITALTSLGHGSFRFDGVAAMRLRPMSELLAVLETLGAQVTFSGQPGYMPFEIQSHGFAGGHLRLKANRTSQQVTALLMIAPYATNDTTIEIEGELVSKPYLRTTTDLMHAWGVEVQQPEPGRYLVQAGQRYRPSHYTIEPDASGASYFFAAAAVLGGRVRVAHLPYESLQGDARFVDVLAAMGCEVVKGAGFLEVVRHGPLHGVEVDLNDMSDTMPTLAAIAPFADSPVTIRNVEHTRWKETDRVTAVVTELRRLGATVEEFRDGLTVFPGPLRGAAVDTYNDHRIAMAFAVAGLQVPGLVINDPGCTAKTFPDFFERLFGMVGARG